MDGKFLEFIRNPPTALRLIDILPLFDGEYGKIEINTKEFLQEAAKNGNLEIKFPIEWDLKDEKVICDGVEKLQLEGETRRLVGR